MEDQVLEGLSVLLGKVIKEAPELEGVMDRAKAGEITETEAMTEMLLAIKANPNLEKRLMEVAQRSVVPVQGKALSIEDDPRAEWLVQLKPNGLPQLNPFFEAYLIERSQFDGDMPELRTGRLIEGVSPSVSVDTKARNPALIGTMMDTASKQVRKDVDTHEAERLQIVNRVAEDDEVGRPRRPVLEAINASGQDLELMQRHSATLQRAADGIPLDALVQGSPETDHPSYRRREVPAPIKVKRVKGSTLAKMTDAQKREGAWKFLSTTQGRRTAVTIIRELIAFELDKKGIEVTERDYDKACENQDILAHHEWTLQLSGAGSTQASFSLIDMAAKALAIQLLKRLPDPYPSGMILEVDTVNKISDRKVGWAARLLPSIG